MSAAFLWPLFEALPLVGILRGFSVEQIHPLVDAALRGGLKNIEITMNSPAAIHQIHGAVEMAGGRMNVGAGTVTNLAQLDAALAAGASFIVTPTVPLDVVTRCVSQNVPVFPGAFSPTEIVRAWEAGATMVKIFPAEALGPGYIHAVKAPLPHIKLLPTGGVDLTTLPLFLQAGADGFGIGSPIFDRKRIEAGDWTWIEARCRAFVESYTAALNTTATLAS